ncbi:LacI family DNA-binding transcriptional regulator [Arthrobacter sp. JZ12]|uniref:LacI family DNA-binding transcriptional regulator n=1 Tax=Arthrobacter sp. JZ12 TaxID=2654190 RepID=UPI002B466485|nr:LacI family DNA-binding transcriptional regulator [Arthrobacter sp. JZ12]WRH25331.1 LacI family DNA-binding transcriptional regulator [Arthrobacter sp. JZ12]
MSQAEAPGAEIVSQRVKRRGPAPASRTNLRAVAQHAGVSAATVSRVLADSESVRPETRDKVLRSVAELGYVVNGLARAMTGRGKQIVAFLVSEMVGPSFAALANGVEQVASENDAMFVLCTTHGDAERELEWVTLMAQQRAAAVLLVGASPMGEQHTSRLKRYLQELDPVGTRLILCGHPPSPDLPRIASISYDNHGGAYELTRHLTDLGHRKILFVGAEPNQSTVSDRLAGYQKALADAGIAADDELIIGGPFTIDGGYDGITLAMNRNLDFTAVLGASDAVSIGALRALKQAGKAVPGDVSLVGIDDVPLTADLTPALTTVHVPFEELGRMTAAVALGLTGEQAEHIELKTELVIRESTGHPPVTE